MRILIFALLLAGCAHQEGVPQAGMKPSQDAHDFVKSAEVYAQKHGISAKAYHNMTLPYAPLDLSSPGKLDASGFASTRLFVFFELAKVYKTEANGLVKDFAGTNAGWSERQADLHKNLGAIQELRRAFLGLVGVNVISQWYEGNQFRVNDWFYFDKNILLPLPAKESGFIPGGEWTGAKGDELARAEMMKSDAWEVAKRMRELKIAAVVRGRHDRTAIIADGYADLAYGYLIMSKANSAKFTPPKEGEWKAVEPGVWFFHGSRTQLEM